MHPIQPLFSSPLSILKALSKAKVLGFSLLSLILLIRPICSSITISSVCRILTSEFSCGYLLLTFRINSIMLVEPSLARILIIFRLQEEDNIDSKSILTSPFLGTFFCLHLYLIKPMEKGLFRRGEGRVKVKRIYFQWFLHEIVHFQLPPTYHNSVTQLP